MIHISFINPLIQFGKKNFDLIVTDDDGRFPDFRVGKKYPQTYSKIQIANDLKNTFIAYIASLSDWYIEHEIIPPTWQDLRGSDIVLDKIGGTKDIWQIT